MLWFQKRISFDIQRGTKHLLFWNPHFLFRESSKKVHLSQTSVFIDKGINSETQSMPLSKSEEIIYIWASDPPAWWLYRTGIAGPIQEGTSSFGELGGYNVYYWPEWKGTLSFECGETQLLCHWCVDEFTFLWLHIDNLTTWLSLWKADVQHQKQKARGTSLSREWTVP